MAIQFNRAAAALAAVAAFAVPAAASAQSYPYTAHTGVQSYGYGQGYYDPCQRDRANRQTAGGLTGAAIGAVIGSQLGARGRRTEGSVLGGVLGAVVGAGVGGNSAGCRPAYDDRYRQQAYGYGNGYDNDRYGDRYDYDRRYDDYDRSREYDDRRYYGDARSTSDGCRLSESRVRLPDGREETRYVQTCPDDYGRYHVVD